MCELLHKEIREDNLLMVSIMLDRRDIDVNVKDKHGQTALHLAVIDNNHLMTQLLLQSRADTGALSNCGQTPLDCARDDEMVLLLGQFMAKHGQYNLIRERLEQLQKQNKLNQKMYKKLQKFQPEKRILPPLSSFLKSRAKKTPDDTDSSRSSRSNMFDSSICDSGYVDTWSAESLSVNSRPEKKTVPVQRRITNPITQQELTAIKAKRFRNIGETRNTGNKIDNKLNKSRRKTVPTRTKSIRSQIRSQDTTSTKKQVTFSSDVLLDIAIIDDEFAEACHLIKSRKVDINRAGPNGLTPLHRAAVEGSYDCLQLLLDQGAEVNIQDEHGWTPLHDAVYHGNISCVAALLKAGANVSLLTYDMHGVLELANKQDVLLVVGRALVLYELGFITDICDDASLLSDRESCV